MKGIERVPEAQLLLKENWAFFISGFLADYEVRAPSLMRHKKFMWGGNIHESKVHGQGPDRK
jgi:hypothetical protein